MNLYLFGWPSNIGGASTKICHLLCLLAGHYDITVVPDDAGHLADAPWRKFLESRGVRCRLLSDLPRRLAGWGSRCATLIFSGKASSAKRADAG